MGKNGIFLGNDVISSVHIDNKGRHFLIPGEGSTQGLDDTTLTAEVTYPIDFTQPNEEFILSLHIMEATVPNLLMLQNYISSKQKTLKLKVMHCV